MHVYEHLFLGQITLRTSRRFRRGFVQQPPLQQTPFCPAAVSYHVDHTHQLYVPQGASCQLYRTSVDLSHSHIVELSEQEVSLLRQGATVQKQTSVDSRPGGSPHVHDVQISCFDAPGYGRGGFAPYPYGYPPGYTSFVRTSTTIY